MIRPTTKEAQGFVALARQYPEFLDYLSRSKQQELEQLPYSKNENLDVLRGRIQTMLEIERLLLGT